MKWTLCISLVFGVSTLVVGACSSDSGSKGNGGAGGADGGGFGGFGATGASSGTGGSGATGATGATGGSGGTGAGTGSYCKGLCGSADAQQGPAGECYCDSQCSGFGDCCPDYEAECGGGGTGGAGGSASGTCKKMCCSAADCASGETCAAFDSAKIGTLGVCTAGTPADGGGSGGAAGGTSTEGGTTEGGTTDAGPAPDAAPPVDGGGFTLPAGCVNSTFKLDCNPLTNAGCDTAKAVACDFGTNSSQEQGAFCFTDGNTQAGGAACDNQNGPWCVPTYHCSQ